MSAATGKRIGKYDIAAQLNRNARAAVYRGEDPEAKKLVAIKIIPRQLLNTAALPAFRKYTAALGKLEHPAIAQVIDIVENDKAVAVISELCEGKAMSLRLKEGAHPELRSVWDIMRPVLEAIALAHSKGAVHRDLKPSNIILGLEGKVKVTDFGLSVLLTGPEAELHYRAPEQFADEQVTARTDVYQLGAIVYHLVTGKLPFTGTPEEIEHRVHEERPSDPSSYNNKIAWQLDWVVQKALSKDPVERFASAAEFADGLRLGLQETVGRPLDPITAPASHKPVPSPLVVKNVQAIPKAPAVPKPADAPAAAPAASVTAVTPAENGKPKILFVDDDDRILNGLRTLFRQDYNVLTASGGEAAMEIVKRGGVHVVVSDQRMPGMTGVELLRKVRKEAPNAVRMLLTGYADLASLVGSINDGEIFRFVKKPWENDELRKDILDAVKAALAKANAAPPAPAESPRTAGSLLVIDPKEGLARGLERLLAGTAGVLQVRNASEAAKALQGQEIAAIVADLGAGMDGLVALFKQVKAKRPGVHTILLADEPDSELGIELINKAQIFRFLPKPVSAKDLRHQVAEALRRYAAYKASAVAQGAGHGGPQPAAPVARTA